MITDESIYPITSKITTTWSGIRRIVCFSGRRASRRVLLFHWPRLLRYQRRCSQCRCLCT